jgi:hypothetical protein
MQGEIPNRKGQAVVHSWFGVRFASGAFQGIEELPDFLKRTGFGQRSFPNPSGAPDLIPAQTLLPEAVRHARLWMSERRAQINAQLAPELATTEAKLDALRQAKYRQLARDFHDENLAGIRLRQKQVREREIERIFADYTKYVQDTLTTEDAAFIRVAAVFRGE